MLQGTRTNSIKTHVTKKKIFIPLLVLRKRVVLPYFSDHYATNFFLTSPGVAYPSAEWGRSKL
jgi:hypothetical protein